MHAPAQAPGRAAHERAAKIDVTRAMEGKIAPLLRLFLCPFRFVSLGIAFFGSYALLTTMQQWMVDTFEQSEVHGRRPPPPRRQAPWAALPINRAQVPCSAVGRSPLAHIPSQGEGRTGATRGIRI